MTLDIERRIGFRQTVALGSSRASAKLAPSSVIMRQNRIAGAVDDSIDGALAIARERLAQGADDRHAAADARLEADGASGLAGRAKSLLAMLRPAAPCWR